MPAAALAALPAPSALFLGKSAIVPVVSAVAQTVVLHHFETLDAIDELFNTNDTNAGADLDL